MKKDILLQLINKMEQSQVSLENINKNDFFNIDEKDVELILNEKNPEKIEALIRIITSKIHKWNEFSASEKNIIYKSEHIDLTEKIVNNEMLSKMDVIKSVLVINEANILNSREVLKALTNEVGIKYNNAIPAAMIILKSKGYWTYHVQLDLLSNEQLNKSSILISALKIVGEINHPFQALAIKELLNNKSIINHGSVLDLLNILANGTSKAVTDAIIKSSTNIQVLKAGNEMRNALELSKIKEDWKLTPAIGVLTSSNAINAGIDLAGAEKISTAKTPIEAQLIEILYTNILLYKNHLYLDIYELLKEETNVTKIENIIQVAKENVFKRKQNINEIIENLSSADDEYFINNMLEVTNPAYLNNMVSRSSYEWQSKYIVELYKLFEEKSVITAIEGSNIILKTNYKWQAMFIYNLLTDLFLIENHKAIEMASIVLDYDSEEICKKAVAKKLDKFYESLIDYNQLLETSFEKLSLKEAEVLVNESKEQEITADTIKLSLTKKIKPKQ